MELFEYINTLPKYDPMSTEEEQQLAKRAQDGDSEARETLITRNLRLVVSISKKYSHHDNPDRQMDLIQTGNQALITAVDNFKPELGRLNKYAFTCIKSQMLGYLQNQGMVRIPDEEKDNPEAQSLKNPISLSTPIGDDDTDLESTIASEDKHHELLLRKEVSGVLNSYLSRLSKRERKVVFEYFVNGRNYSDIAKDINISGERVSQIYEIAMRKLRRWIWIDDKAQHGNLEEILRSQLDSKKTTLQAYIKSLQS